ncbi:MAG: TrkH family potassium uptake protein [Saprospiraceae bacterium]|nr:TrkH family potassium uptake protein [Lewinella sp.]
MINFKPVIRVIGFLISVIGGFMLLSVGVSWYYKSGDGWALMLSAFICLAAGVPGLMIKSDAEHNIRKREGYLIVALGWLGMVSFSALPYILSGVIPGIPDAIFESVSGMTTTGASVLTDIESVPQGILFWRSLTQWIGGMGIIVLTVAIFPLLGIGGIELFVAEAPGPTSDKLHPRIRETAKRLWLIYVSLTGVLAICLVLLGMSVFDAVNHAFTTMATGGFSTKNASMSYYGPAVQYVVIIFMFLAGTNYTVLYYSLKRRFGTVWNSDEFRAYLLIVVVAILLVTGRVYAVTDLSLEQAFRDSAFQIVSLITTTGFVSADYTAWSSGLTMFFFILLFVGASAGSTSGGIKIIRHLVFFKNSFFEFKRILHPRAIVPLKINQKRVRGRVITHIIIFLLLYLSLFLFGSIVLSVMGYDFMTAIGAVATSLGNVGPGVGDVGPVDNFAWLSGNAKLFLSFLMLLGRLELFTILVLFTPYFWKSN